MNATNHTQSQQSAGGLTLAEFIQIYQDTAEVYEGDQTRAKFELPDLIPEIKQALSDPRQQADVTNLVLTYFFCDLFGRHGPDEEAAWQEATQRTDQAGAIELQLDRVITLRIEPTTPELKQCPGPNCNQYIKADFDYCLKCRNREQRLQPRPLTTFNQ